MSGLDIIDEEQLDLTESLSNEFRVCANCHREVQLGVKFCPNCGTSADGFIDYVSERVLPKCPECGASLDYGANLCDECGAKIEWKSNKELLVGLDALTEHEALPRSNRPRHHVQYKQCTVMYNSIDFQLNPKGRRLGLKHPYSKPRVQYNSFSCYSK